ncbi:carbohydrate ABC transporter permease [Lapidilactobacillus luobeiensis]|uniref:carbohydrate ABC transporter permease n=1 Tax=Lapidilactobacillus luobeiensis TaxID=2950371 RepID=UPI0021C3C6E5|nr:carbohydrate ABC transporter permease [Lapidilactobacillus luobeiensis]
MDVKVAKPVSRKVKKTKGDRVFDVINVVIMTLFSLIIILPMWNIVISSFAAKNSGNFIFWPNKLSMANYIRVFSDNSLWNAMFISVAKTLVGVLLHLMLCSIVAYALSKRNLRGRGLYASMGIITMFFSGGMIPTYLLIKSLGLLNTFWVYIIPSMFSYYDIVILMNFFRDIPDSLEESAKIDGANDWLVFFKIILPLSKPAMATIGLFHGVWQWNDFMTAKLYVTNEALYPLQMRLYDIIVQSQAAATAGLNAQVTIATTSKGVQLATIVVTMLPILVLYPFLQKYFVTGTMLGAVKE